ncbi:MAG: hypothetical protein M4D80_19785 [Myxococcota bacterium]|nr:hypothetical protein [Myxococcota bacterium]
MKAVDEIERDVIAHPERDDLRLEFADAIYSHDPERAQFVRTFVTRANPTWEELNQAKVDHIKERLEAPFRRFGDVGVTFDRGFPTTAYLPLETFLEHGDEILSLAPILEVVLRLPLDEDAYRVCGARSDWNAYLPALAQCPALARVRELVLGIGWFDFAAMKHLVTSPFIDRLLRFTPGDWTYDRSPERDRQEDEMWPLLLDSPVFRRMIDWGVSGATRRYQGDRITKEPYQHFDETTRYTVRYEPMDEESRALEQKYGYIPCLHAGNWDATVLDVLRGIKPDYPVGATPTEEMYAVPPQKDTSW